MKFPEVHGVSKSLDLNMKPEKKPLKGSNILQDKPHTGQGRTGMKRRRPPPINQSITETSELSKKIPQVSKIKMRITKKHIPQPLYNQQPILLMK